MNLITSLHNPKIKQIINLRDKRDRDRSSLFLIEGYREVFRAANAKWTIESLFICADLFLGVNESSLIHQLAGQGTNIYECSQQVFRKISYRDRPDGLLAIAPQKKRTLTDLEFCLNKKNPPFLVVAEAIEKPGNLGTILRSSDAVGVDGLIVCDRCTDVFNPNVVRASVGTLFTVPTVEDSGENVINWLREHQVTILAATPQAERVYTDIDMTKPIAIAVGTEQLGLTDRWMNQATMQVRIPMCGIADSQNVAMATTLLLYEALRQRQKNS